MGKTHRRNPQHFGVSRARYVEKKVRRDYNSDLRSGCEYVRADPQARKAAQRESDARYAEAFAAYHAARAEYEQRFAEHMARARDIYPEDCAYLGERRFLRHNPAPQRPWRTVIPKWVTVPFDGRPFEDYLDEKGAEYADRFAKAHRDGQAKSDIRYGRGVGETEASVRRVWDRNALRKVILDPEVAENMCFSAYKEGRKHYWDWY